MLNEQADHQMSSMRLVELKVNGISRNIAVRNADTLLSVLREQLGLTGAKQGCGNGDCGACAVLINGQPIHACQMLAVEGEHVQITTIEGLQDTPIQQAFVKHWAIQCGYCTSGFIINGHALLNHHPNADENTVDEWLGSNLCRCTGYAEIKQAVMSELERGR